MCPCMSSVRAGAQGKEVLHAGCGTAIPLQLAHLCSDVSSHVPVCVLKCARMRPDMYPYVSSNVPVCVLTCTRMCADMCAYVS